MSLIDSKTLPSRLTFAKRAASILAKAALVLPRYAGARQCKWMLKIPTRRQGWRAFDAITHDGLQLACAWAPAQTSRPGTMPIIVAPGYLEIKEVHWRMVGFLQRAGHDVLLFDQRAHGDSQGKRTTLGVLEQRDVSAVIDAGQKLGVVDDRVSTIGMSLGAATALLNAAKESRVKGVVAMAPFFSAHEAIRQYRRNFLPFMPQEATAAAVAQLEATHDFSFDDADVHQAVSALHTPVNGAGHLSLVMRTWPGMYERIQSFCQSLEEDSRIFACEEVAEAPVE